MPFVGVLLQPSSVPVPRLTNNLQPDMSTAINRLISSDLEKDILVFGRPTVACPGPWAGASAAGGAGDALSQEYPAPCSVSPHKNSFICASSCSLIQLQDPCRYCSAFPSPVPSNPPDESGNGCGHPHVWCMLLPNTAPVIPSTGSREKQRPECCCQAEVRKGRDGRLGGCQLLDQRLKIWPLTGWS